MNMFDVDLAKAGTKHTNSTWPMTRLVVNLLDLSGLEFHEDIHGEQMLNPDDYIQDIVIRLRGAMDDNSLMEDKNSFDDTRNITLAGIEEQLWYPDMRDWMLAQVPLVKTHEQDQAEGPEFADAAITDVKPDLGE